MVKLEISQEKLAIVLHQEFYVFYRDCKKLSWMFDKVVKCAEKVPKSSGSIECCSFSPCGKYFGICFDKNIIIYKACDWVILHACPGERKASSLQFFPSSKLVLVADKSGTVNFYPFTDSNINKTEFSFGHNSMLTSALVTKDEKFVITSDRDEKIRITNFKNVYNIEMYCLGHEMFVTCMGFLPTNREILISSSGDGTIRFWKFITGQQVALYDCNEDHISKKTITKFVSCGHNYVSYIAIVEYKSNKIKVIAVNDDLSINLVKILTLKSVPWDVAFCKEVLLCLSPDKNNPVTLWHPEQIKTNENFTNITSYLCENWDSYFYSCNQISDEIPVLFKREVDNLQEYEQRKKARLLKTGKTS